MARLYGKGIVWHLALLGLELTEELLKFIFWSIWLKLNQGNFNIKIDYLLSFFYEDKKQNSVV